MLVSFLYTLGLLLSRAYAHEEHSSHDHAFMSGISSPVSGSMNSTGPVASTMESYYFWKEERMLLYSHIVTMVVSWVLIMPFGG